ncbi:unnamed protein product, partial [marine sediment metagenome]
DEIGIENEIKSDHDINSFLVFGKPYRSCYTGESR